MLTTETHVHLHEPSRRATAEAIGTAVPVSYTHLDVYKRQAQDRARQHLVVNGVLPPDVSGDRLAAAIHQRESRALADLPPALAGMPCTHVPLRADTNVGLAAVLRLLADDAVLSADCLVYTQTGV